MPSFSPAPVAARTSAAINADIRALWKSAGGRLSAEDETVYARLLVEWAEVSRAEGVDAARKVSGGDAPAGPVTRTAEPMRRTAGSATDAPRHTAGSAAESARHTAGRTAESARRAAA
ncbi:hypothetical protein [uncultured Streptomyces sp.]|uniref:hypothetical protein n=1 Tax=uncultured Streptomyces sp. TaxID=174707 RepID=UPI00262AD7BD|nr:hypothetical protein [uncultured Streptomyces sp.]